MGERNRSRSNVPINGRTTRINTESARMCCRWGRSVHFMIHTRHSGCGHRNGRFDGALASIIEGGLSFSGSSRSACCAAQASQSANGVPRSTSSPSRLAPSAAAWIIRRIRSARSQPAAARCRARTRASSCLIASARRARSAAICSASAFSAARFSSSDLPDRAICMKPATISGGCSSMVRVLPSPHLFRKAFQGFQIRRENRPVALVRTACRRM